MGDRWWEAVHPDDRDRYRGICRDSLSALRPFTVDYRLLRHDGEFRWVLDHGAPLLDPGGRHLGFLISGADVTEQKHAEQQARQGREAAERAMRLNQRLIATASHDFLQPLMTAGLLVRQLSAGTLGAEQRDAVERLQLSLDSMRGIFSELIDLSVESAGRAPHHECCLLSDIAGRVGQMYEPVAAAKALRMAIYMQPLQVVSNRALLERVVRNLVDNAVKYTDRGRVIVAVRPIGREARLQIWDSGLGIAAEHLPNIFAAYNRIDDTADGVGLGLYTVRRLCDMLGHDLVVRSTPGRGSLFEIRLPLATSCYLPDGHLPEGRVPEGG